MADLNAAASTQVGENTGTPITTLSMFLFFPSPLHTRGGEMKSAANRQLGFVSTETAQICTAQSEFSLQCFF